MSDTGMNGINGHNIRILNGLSRDMARSAQARTKGAFALCMDDPDLVRELKAMGVKTIYRQSGDDPTHNPIPESNDSGVIKAAAVAFTDERGKKNADFVHLTNELGSTPKLHEFTRYCLERCSTQGWKGVAYNYYTHADEQHFMDALDNIRYAVSTRQAVGVHMYPDYAHDATVANFLRIKSEEDGLWIATEFNYTRDYRDAHRGWRNLPESIWRDLGFTSLEQFRQSFIRQWSKWLAEHGIPSTWFSLDYWDQPTPESAKEFGYGYFDLEDVLQEMATQNTLYTFTGEAPSMPDYTAHDWGQKIEAATASVNQTINVRKAPTEDASGTPTGELDGGLANGSVVSYWDKPFQNSKYLWWKIRRVVDAEDRYCAQVSGLTFTVVVEPPSDTVEIKASDLNAALDALQRARADLIAQKAVIAQVLADNVSALAQVDAAVALLKESAPPPSNGGSDGMGETVVIDVSAHQDVIDWALVVQDVDEAYIRATMGATGVDDRLASNAAGIAAQDGEWGFYHLFRADGDPLVQAQHFWTTVEPLGGALIPTVDVEQALGDVALPPDQYAARLKQFIIQLEALAGVTPMIYTSASQWALLTGNSTDAAFSRCPLWVAHYGVDKPSLPSAWQQWALWQYTSDGAVDGIDGQVDMNHVMPLVPFRLSYPLAGAVIIQPFGVNTTGVDDFYTQFGLPAHEGLDWRAPAGTPVLACAAGVVARIERQEFTGSGSPYGIQVRIRHQWGNEAYETIYAHLQSVAPELAVGRRVKRGQAIGLSNNTGNSRGDHLHLSFKRKGNTEAGIEQQLGDGAYALYPSDLVDPTPYLTT